jgi:hypothetical protein
MRRRISNQLLCNDDQLEFNLLAQPRIFKGGPSQSAKGVASRKLWHALQAIDKYLSGQAAWLVNSAKRYRAGLRVGTSITEGQRTSWSTGA